MNICRDTVAGEPRGGFTAGTLDHLWIVEVTRLLDHVLDRGRKLLQAAATLPRLGMRLTGGRAAERARS
jgi:hypothetical protein